jgi:two-component system, sensor histidine kinase and response regulator
MTTILLVEDNPDMLTMLTQVLEWGDEYKVIPGRSGLEGVDILSTLEILPDLIISDISMPEMDGLELLARVRSHPDWSSIPFVVMSARASADERRGAQERGADDFLVKPFSLEDFKRILERWQK